MLKKEELTNISSGVTLDHDIAENILNVVDVGKSRMKVFRQKQLIFQRNIISCADKENKL